MSQMKFEKYLKVLGLETGVSLKEIKNTYKKMVLKYHPDRQTDPIAKKTANEKLKKINEAREFLIENYKYYGHSDTKQKAENSSTSNKDTNTASKTKKENKSSTRNRTAYTKERKAKFNMNLYAYHETDKINLKSLAVGIVTLLAIVIFASSTSHIGNSTAYNNVYAESENYEDIKYTDDYNVEEENTEDDLYQDTDNYYASKEAEELYNDDTVSENDLYQDTDNYYNTEYAEKF